MRMLISLLLAIAIAFGFPPPVHAESLDGIARDYAELYLSSSLLRDPNVEVDRTLADQLERARAARRDLPAIGSDVRNLISRIDALPSSSDPMINMRRRALRVRLTALELSTLPAGTNLPVAEEVQRRFGFFPAFRPLSEYEPAVARLDAAMPGEGTLAERIAAMRRSAAVPPDRIEAVFRAAMAECRRRTAAHIALPAEQVDVELVEDDVTPALAGYAGNGRSFIRISKTIPTDVDRLLQHACHEVYPGHHVHYLAMDNRLFRERGWPEYGVGIDSDPLIPVAEAVAEYGVGLAFPIEERIAFERAVLYPLAGRAMTNEDQWRAYLTARSDLLGATATIVRDFLSGAINEDNARQALVRYRLQTPEAAQQTLRMIRAFGSYIIASDFGWFAVDRAMRGRSQIDQWQLLQRLQNEPMLLDDILALQS